jgi:3D (Asp-Asp-Asp) domain-containing protein
MKYLPLLLILSLLSACVSQPPSHSRPAKTAAPARTATRPTPKPASAPSTGQTRLVRTTAYCHLEDGNRRNAISGNLAAGHYYSAAADWSRFPAGTVFRLLENGRTYVVDDYGSALVGTETIDLYVPSMSEMNHWGVRRVHIQILKPGSYTRSLSILRPRASRGYIRRMVRDLENKVR